MILRMFLQGLIPIYPFIMGKMNATSSDIGIFLSFSYVFLFLGTYLIGIVVPKYLNPKVVLLGSVLPMVSSLAAYGMIHNIWLFDLCGCALSFFLGLHVCSNNILMGLYSSEASLSKNFSTLSVSSILATVLGGFIVGPMLTWLGFKSAFVVFASVLLLFSLLLIPLSKPGVNLAIQVKKPFKIDTNLWLLLASIFLVSLLLYGFKMSISIMLKRRSWTISEISIMMALGTSLAIPVTIWWGKVSNYFNAKRLLLMLILCGFIAYSSLLGVGFYPLGIIGFACISVVAYSINIPVMSIIYRWYDHQSLPRAQSLTSSAVWFSAIIGFLGNGYAMEHFSETTCISTGLLICLLAFVPLLTIKFGKNIALQTA